MSNPARWPPYELDHPKLAGLRKCSVAGFRKYLVFYLVHDGIVDIVRILHGARDIPAILYEDAGSD